MAIITNREQLDALPIGTRGTDRDGWGVHKTGATEYDITNPEDSDVLTVDAGELCGSYSGEGSEFLPIVTDDETDMFTVEASAIAHVDPDTDEVTIIAQTRHVDPFGFAAAIDTGAIDNLTPDQLDVVSDILKKVK